MSTTEPAGPAAQTGDAERGGPYHHGNLKQALLDAAEALLRREGVGGLTLRAAAAETGVSHAAPKNHFGDLRGLQSELAASGFRRLAGQMRAALDDAATADDAMDAIGRAYVAFAVANPGLFNLMYRSEMLDADRPALKSAVSDMAMLLRGAVVARAGGGASGVNTAAIVADITAAWSLVHGFATLLVDGRLAPLLAHVKGENPESSLLDLVLASRKTRPPAR